MAGRFRSFFSVRTGSIRDRMIRQHSRWLSRMVRRDRLPVRIPVRRVSEGGFEALVVTEPGRRIARAWWDAALERAG